MHLSRGATLSRATSLASSAARTRRESLSPQIINKQEVLSKLRKHLLSLCDQVTKNVALAAILREALVANKFTPKLLELMQIPTTAMRGGMRGGIRGGMRPLLLFIPFMFLWLISAVEGYSVKLKIPETPNVIMLLECGDNGPYKIERLVTSVHTRYMYDYILPCFTKGSNDRILNLYSEDGTIKVDNFKLLKTNGELRTDFTTIKLDFNEFMGNASLAFNIDSEKLTDRQIQYPTYLQALEKLESDHASKTKQQIEAAYKYTAEAERSKAVQNIRARAVKTIRARAVDAAARLNSTQDSVYVVIPVLTEEEEAEERAAEERAAEEEQKRDEYRLNFDRAASLRSWIPPTDKPTEPLALPSFNSRVDEANTASDEKEGNVPNADRVAEVGRVAETPKQQSASIRRNPLQYFNLFLSTINDIINGIKITWAAPCITILLGGVVLGVERTKRIKAEGVRAAAAQLAADRAAFEQTAQLVIQRAAKLAADRAAAAQLAADRAAAQLAAAQLAAAQQAAAQQAAETQAVLDDRNAQVRGFKIRHTPNKLKEKKSWKWFGGSRRKKRTLRR